MCDEDYLSTDRCRDSIVAAPPDTGAVPSHATRPEQKALCLLSIRSESPPHSSTSVQTCEAPPRSQPVTRSSSGGTSPRQRCAPNVTRRRERAPERLPVHSRSAAPTTLVAETKSLKGRAPKNTRILPRINQTGRSRRSGKRRKPTDDDAEDPMFGYLRQKRGVNSSSTV